MPAHLATRLRDEGHDVTDVVAEGLGGEDDARVLAAATAEDRILLTFDLDFADIRHYRPGTHAGIVVFRLEDQRWRTLEGGRSIAYWPGASWRTSKRGWPTWTRPARCKRPKKTDGGGSADRKCGQRSMFE